MHSSESRGVTESFPAFSKFPGIAHLFIRRIPGIDVHGEREEVLNRLAASHDELRAANGLDGPMVSAQQVHGAEIRSVTAQDTRAPIPGVDGLITRDPGVVLAIYVADCCAVYLVDRRQLAIGLVHSGKKGTELGITQAAITAMQREFGSDPADLVVQLSPCIRPPLYEIDFASAIRAQALAAGVGEVHDCETCTGANPTLYYSYRMESGKTGRLLALLKIAE